MNVTSKVLNQVLATLELQAAYLKESYTIPFAYKVWGDDPEAQRAKKEHARLVKLIAQVRKA